MSYDLFYSNKFKKSLKKCQKRGLNLEKLKICIKKLVERGSLPAEYKPHKLTGSYEGKWECHIEPDWLLIWEQNDSSLTLLMVNTGSHSDLF